MKKIDFKKEYKNLYLPSPKEVVVVDIPKMNFLTVDGHGDPNNSLEFQSAIEALYGIAFTLKFLFKKGEKPKHYFEFVVPPLEGLWWVDGETFDPRKKDEWNWKLMIMQPPFITKAMVGDAISQARQKKNSPAFDRVRFEPFHEGLCAQLMHIGPYSAEEKTIARIHEFIKKKGHKFRGKHHEIYTSDPRKVAPAKMKTVVRYPIVRSATRQ